MLTRIAQQIDARALMWAALIAAGALSAAGCGGGSDTPAAIRTSTHAAGTAQPSATAAAKESTKARGNGVDRAFVAAMVSHHRTAMTMARIARRHGTSTFVRRLAGGIVATQGRETSAMRHADDELALAGVKPGSLGLPVAPNGAHPRTLTTAKPFDAAFLRMMLVHHQRTIEMARVEIVDGRNPGLRSLAAKIMSARKLEARRIREQLGRQTTAGPRRIPPSGGRDPRSGSPDMPGADDAIRLPAQVR